MLWYVSRGTAKRGPLSEAEMLRLIEAGRILPTDMVWRSGMSEWRPAGEVGGLFQPPPNVSASKSLPPLETPTLPGAISARLQSVAPVAKPSMSFGGYLLAHWQGRLDLATSFWLNVVLVGLLFAIGVPYLVGAVWVSAPSVSGFLLLAAVLFYPAMVVWQCVGLYRCALAHIQAPASNFKLWAHLSLIYSVLPVAYAPLLIVAVIGGVSALGSSANATFTTISDSM